MYFEDVQKRFFQAVEQLHPDVASVVKSAYEVAEREHQGQLRKPHKTRPDDLDPYLIHPLRVSLILMQELELCDVTVLASAVLHDVVEDGNSRPTIEDIKKQFGADIAKAVDYLTKPEGEHGPEALIPYHTSFYEAPLHVRLVKLSDRLDNLRETLLVDRPRFQNRYLRETREIYIPIANQTSNYFAGEMTELCNQLESLLKQAQY